MKSLKEHVREDMAWCPDCNDSLETKTIWRDDKKYGKIIDHWEYYCFGCDKTFLLTEKPAMVVEDYRKKQSGKAVSRAIKNRKV